MEKIDLCELWARFAAKPNDPDIAGEARKQLVEFLSHVDDCPRCRAVSEDAREPELMFAALAASDTEPLPAAERAQLEAGHRAFAEGTSAIEDAVATALVEPLPETLHPPPTVAPLQVFLATDAVNLLARSMSAEYPDVLLDLTPDGLFAGGKHVATRSEVANDIAEHASLSPEMADDLLKWQLDLLNARPRLNLYRGLLTIPSTDGVLLVRVPSKSAEELAALWSEHAEPTVVEIPAAIESILPDVLLETVEAVMSVEAPALEQVGVTLQQAGEPELGELLVAQSENEKEEKETFGYVLAHGFEKPEASIEARLKQLREKIEEHRKRWAGAQTKVTVVNSHQAYAAAMFAKQQVITRRGLYQQIVSYQPVGGVNLQPIQAFCAHGIEWANLELQYLGRFQAPQGSFTATAPKSGVHRMGKA